ncbi:MAG TPA: SAM-dependent methyltransferase, partial [Streptosporangiaceae bacterium]|nr:SAM-dependent methyltransferase [Streptosporangiaceae bacterium]
MTDQRAAGETEQHDAPAGIDTSKAHQARIYDYWLGGKDNFAI